MIRRGVRVAERASLESLCTAMYRGFESRPLRRMHQKKPRIRGVFDFLGRGRKQRFQCLGQKSKIAQRFF